MDTSKKIVLPAALFLFLAVVFYAAGSQGLLAKIIGRNGAPPVITNAFIDKAKYFPGDIMTITAETENADSVKAFVENEKGFNQVNLVMTVNFNGKETWMGRWKVENSLNGKKYRLKIIASNKFGQDEKNLEWEDPNPGHPASAVTAGTFDTGDFTFPNNLDVNGNFTVKNGNSITLGGTARTNWPVMSSTSCKLYHGSTVIYTWDGIQVLMKASCTTGIAISGGCVFDYGSGGANVCPSPKFYMSNDRSGYVCGCVGINKQPVEANVLCCE